ncbi:TRAP transporter substrate-binding protein [Portibacter marinus]|uniref:TRAP transporter substrate-binding protein n=1 Tax=Portibacter marinus TaxID=2898660 RepID=UPI001F1A1ADC|nr:TRAP transporter substrate-binding protein [Portibacter marinus]
MMYSCSEVTETKRVLLAHTLPISHPVHKGMEVFAEEAERISGGKLSVKIFPDGQLGSEREVLELLQIGSISMTKVSAAAMSNFAPKYKVLGIPYIFRDHEHLFNVLEGPVGKELLQAGSEFLLQGLCFYDAGSRSFYTKEKPIVEPDDLNGMKIRVMNDQMSVSMVNALGGSATPMSYGELYTALQQGVVDGAENNPPSFVTSRHYEICKYYSLDEHSSLPDVLVIGTKFWNTLSPQQQEWLQQAADASVVAQKKFWKDNVDECMVILEDAGVEIIRPDKSKFAEKASIVKERFANDPEMTSLIERIEQQK